MPPPLAASLVWPGLRSDVKLWYQACVTCQQSKIHRHTISPLQTFVTPSEKFQHIQIYIVSPLAPSCDHSYSLTNVNKFSRWMEALPSRDISAKSCADAFVLNFVAGYGAPLTMTLDKGKQSTSNLWKKLAKFVGCELIHTKS